MLLRNADNNVPKTDLYFNNYASAPSNNQFISQSHLSNGAPQYENQWVTANYTGYNLSTTKDTNISSISSPTNNEYHVNQTQSLPSQIDQQNHYNQNIPYSIPPISLKPYQEYTQHIQQNVAATTTTMTTDNLMPLSPPSLHTQLPQIFYHSNNGFNNDYNSNNSLPPKQMPITDANQLCHSFVNLLDNPSSKSSSTFTEVNVHELSSARSNGHTPNHNSGNNMTCPMGLNPNYTPLDHQRAARLPGIPLSNPHSPYPSIVPLYNQPPNVPPPPQPVAPDNLIPSRRMINIMEEKVLIPPTGVTNPVPNIMHITKKSNCSPDIMRCTLNAVPCNDDILTKSRLPLAILLHPFRDLPSLQVIRSKKLIRCRSISCRAYINPFVKFIDHRRWRCNLCQRMNELTDSMLYGDSHESLKRFELRLPTVEYITPKEYKQQPAITPLYVFLIDLSCQGGLRRVMSTVLGTVAELLDRLPGCHLAKAAVIGYDRVLHFYEVGGNGQCREIVQIDVDEPLDVPVLCSRLLVDVMDHCEGLRAVLETVLDNGDDDDGREGCCLGSALLVAKRMMAEHGGGGRITVFNASCPSLGEGALHPGGTLLAPSTDFYKTLSVELALQQVSVDLVQLGAAPVDLASLSAVTRHSGGNLHRYPNLVPADRAPSDCARLLADLRRLLTRKVGLAALLHLRLSSRLRLLSLHGNCLQRASDLFSLSTASPDDGIALRLGLDNSGGDGDDDNDDGDGDDANTAAVFVQASLLYTSVHGDRRVRVHNLCLQRTARLDDVFRFADQQAVAAFLAKAVADRLQAGVTVLEARLALLNAVLDPLRAFRRDCLPPSPSPSPGPAPLHLPFHLRLLPLYVHALLRSHPLSTARDADTDRAVAELSSWRCAPLATLLVAVHPNLYDLGGVLELTSRQRRLGGGGVDSHSPVADDNGSASSSSSLEDSDNVSCYDDGSESRASSEPAAANDDGDDDDEFWYPEHLHLSTPALLDRPGGVFLLDAGVGLLLLLTNETPRPFLRLIFGIESLAEAPRDGFEDLPELANPCSVHLRVFVRQLQVERPIGSQLVIVTGDSAPWSTVFLDWLLEDDRAGGSYQRFLQHLHHRVDRDDR